MKPQTSLKLIRNNTYKFHGRSVKIIYRPAFFIVFRYIQIFFYYLNKLEIYCLDKFV